MPAVQTDFPGLIPRAQPGQLEGRGSDDGSLKANAAIPFGRATKHDESAGTVTGVSKGVAQAANKVTNFAGVTAKRPQYEAAQYSQHDMVGLRTRGLVWVQVTSAVKRRNRVLVNAVEGTFSTGNASAANPELEDAAYMDDAPASGYARVNLDVGPLK